MVHLPTHIKTRPSSRTMPPNFEFLPLGAILKTFTLHSKNLVLGFNTTPEYAHNPSHFGATIGRVANRIAAAKIGNLNGVQVTLSANNGENSLHGGAQGWGKRVWEGPFPELHGGVESVRFEYTSEDGEEGFPGTVKAGVRYSPREEAGRVVLEVEFWAELVGGVEETVVNMTNHSYFNIGPGPTIAGTEATLSTNLHLPLDSSGIPVGTTAAPFPSIAPNKPFPLTATSSIDDIFVHASSGSAPASVPLDTRPLPLQLCGSFYHPDTEIHLLVESTEPAFQFYTGKYVDVEERADGTPRRVANAGFCVEPSRFVDAVNREEWRGMVVLKRGEKYGGRIRYSAWEGERE